ncbi:MAG: hypothetical protein H6Q56_718 [Deltaproteobacteria bacterium]|nr:hypothetical protein [Deltaproteobacteria bacterium]
MVKTFLRQFLHTPILAIALLLATIAPSAAGSYRWTDRTGTLHFSDTLPAEDVPLDNLDPADPEQRPLLEKPLLIYSDKVFRLTLTAESEDLLQFELSYTDIQRIFPEVISGNARLQICAVDRERSSTYLAYSVQPVEGGRKTFQLTNRLSKQSPSDLETESLSLSLYDNGPDRKKYRNLLTREIPFGKIWHKRKGVVYQ